MSSALASLRMVLNRGSTLFVSIRLIVNACTPARAASSSWVSACFEEIVRVAPYTYRVPSCSGEHTYVVDLKHGGCTCRDHPPKGERCKHSAAAAYKKARTATCSGCGGRFRHRGLVEVGEENLTFFEGDLLCRRECAGAHGVL